MILHFDPNRPKADKPTPETPSRVEEAESVEQRLARKLEQVTAIDPDHLLTVESLCDVFIERDKEKKGGA